MVHASIRVHKLKKIVGLNSFNLTSVELSLLARAVSKLEIVNLDYTNLTNNEMQSPFQTMTLKCQLRKLDLYGINLSSVEPELSVKVVTTLKDVNQDDTKLTNNQSVEKAELELL